MVQGDEPMVYPEMIDESLEPFFNDESVNVTNLVGNISSDNEFNDKRNCIKVVLDNDSNALYFSREPIPTLFKTKNVYEINKFVSFHLEEIFIKKIS